ncbi:MAG TPA: CCA tRNA nucleotidyltransferase [Candidatus Dormibacteraeota bacterium]|jgi:poly(A) polymerase|nr:CCA tRNA nucleotidyltransferase [Candidatus Dormibacteraeota bacterium]
MNARELANSICDTLVRNGFQALFAGGCVRDLLLGRAPADYDVTTNATPAQVMELFPDSVAVGAQFGVILIPRDGLKVEVATFRSDIGYSDGRHPDAVVYAKTAEQDVQRRDFTINGLLMRHDTSEVLDYIGGREDLKAGTIRAIGEPDRRFEEDKLRMLRAVRFAARFDFEIEAETFRAIRKHVNEIDRVSAERVRDELTKLLTEGSAGNGFRLLDQTWLLQKVLPEIAAMKGVEQPPQYHPEGDVWTHTCMMLDGIPVGAPPTLAWGVLLHDVGKPPTFRSAAETGDRIRFDGHVEVGVRMGEEICHRLKMSNDETEQIASLISNHMRFKDAEQMRTSTLKRFLRLPKFEEHMQLHRLDCLSSNRNLESYNFVRSFLDQTPAEQVRPPRLLTGDDLVYMGYKPGPKFSEILRSVEDAQLEGIIKTREEALKYIEEAYATQEKG